MPIYILFTLSKHQNPCDWMVQSTGNGAQRTFLLLLFNTTVVLTLASPNVLQTDSGQKLLTSLVILRNQASELSPVMSRQVSTS